MPHQALLAVLVIVAAVDQLASAADPFVDPPARFRILPIIHGLPNTPAAQDKMFARLTSQGLLPDPPATQDKLLATLASRGFGGMVTNVCWKDYLQSDSLWQSFVDEVHKAKQAGLALWLYDEHGYPSGNAGGLTMQEHPEWEARGLLIADRIVRGGSLTLDLPPGSLRRAVALPIVAGRVDLDKAVDLSGQIRERRLLWDGPDGQWHVMLITEDRLYEGTHAAVSLCDKLPYINLLRPEPTTRFLELTHDAYARRLGNNLGQWFVATFTDEPSLMSVFLQPQPYRVLPWASNLTEQFQKRRGYALEPLLPALVADAGSRSARTRYDFWLTVSELVAENYFGQIRDWCHRHQVLSGGHLMAEESLLSHVPYYGDFFRCARMLDAPGIDCLTSIPPQVPWHIARLVSSAGELEGCPDTMCETSDFLQRARGRGDRYVVTEDEIRGTCNRLIVNGITTITSYYSFKGLTDEQLRRLNLWIGRTCMTLYGGHQVTDVALVYPIESLWSKFVPSTSGTNDVSAAGQQIGKVYRQASNELFTNNRDFTFIDARTLAEAQVKDGVLCHRDLRWRVVVLPGVDTLPIAAWRNLAQFWRTGGVVVTLGSLPTNSASEFPSPVVQSLAQELFGGGTDVRSQINPAKGVGVYLPVKAVGGLIPVLNAILDPQVRVVGEASPLRSTHRQIGGREAFFLINDSAKAWEGTVSLAAAGLGQQLDPATGEITPVTGPEGLRVALTPYGGTLFRFDKNHTPNRRAVSLQDLPTGSK